MIAVIMAGGSGTRFWPASRKRKPKQFMDITGNGPMLLETLERIGALARDREIIIVLGREHRDEAGALLGNRPVHIVAEPMGRNTAPCMGLGAIYARSLGYADPLAFLPADHFVGDPKAYLEALQAAEEAARRGSIVTLGIVPTRPETGYGYIRRESKALEAGNLKSYRVSSFTEKPDLENARRYLAEGDYFWNAGIFVATPETIIDEINTYLPDLFDGLVQIEKLLGTEQFETTLEEVYTQLLPISFDHGIMEKTEREVYVVPCDCAWSDVGSWASLYELRSADRDAQQNLVDGQALLIDCEGSFVRGLGQRLVACLGIKNCLVIDTPETLLVADLDRSQDIRDIVEGLKKAGKGALI
jgi:mannose-1-phosphate guanylyltransferase